jgi:hypothetical protein
MRWSEIRVTLGLCVAMVFVLVGCGSDDRNDENAAKTVVFDSGRGSGAENKQTYGKYHSEVLVMPLADVSISSIKPDMWYCNGTCGYIATIRDEYYGYLASQAGSIDGNNTEDIHLPVRNFDSVVHMNTGTSYRIILEAWSTQSAGIYTTGTRTTGTLGNADYSAVSAYSIIDDANHTVDYIDRGVISFQLLQ